MTPLAELDLVASATEEATLAVLGAAEEIEAAANRLKAAGEAIGADDPVGIILERVALLYETCIFQDVAAQRLGRVARAVEAAEIRLGPAAAAPLQGPSPPDEQGRVSQPAVDALSGR